MSDTENIDYIDQVLREACEIADPADRERRLDYLLSRRFKAMQRRDQEPKQCV